MHVVHITSMGLRETALCLEMIQGARARGLDVTTEAYPYTAGMTDLGSAIFSEGWQERQGGITFGDLQWAATGERLTAESFARYRKQGGFVAIHSHPGGDRAAGDGESAGDDGERRHSGRRQGPSARRRHVRARAGALRARAARAEPDGRGPQDDGDARRPPGI